MAARQEKLQRVDEKLRTSRTQLLEDQRASLGARREADQRYRDALRVEKGELDTRLQALLRLAEKATKAHCIRTETEPPIHYRPKAHNTVTRTLLRVQQRESLPPLVEELASLEALPAPAKREVVVAEGRSEDTAMAEGAEGAPAAAAPAEEEEDHTLDAGGDEPLDAMLS